MIRGEGLRLPLLLRRNFRGARVRFLRASRPCIPQQQPCEQSQTDEPNRRHEYVIYNPNRSSDEIPCVVARVRPVPPSLLRCVAIVITKTPLGSPVFLACFAVMAGAYGLILARVWREERAPRGLLAAAFALAVAFRVPLAIPQAGADSDMVRYVWDGRVQTLGYNPYLVVPSDPAMSATHTTETRQMPSLRARTPYPPGAQLFFRFVVGLHDSSRAMKLALVACDLLTIAVLWRWLVVTRALRMAGARVCVESAGRAGNRAQRAYRRTRRALDRRIGLLADEAAYGARVDRVRPRRHHEDSPDRAPAALLGADPPARRARRRGAVPAVVPAVHLGSHPPVRGGAQRRRLHPVQRPAVQADRGACDAAARCGRCRRQSAWRSLRGVVGGCRYPRPKPGRGRWRRRWSAHR